MKQIPAWQAADGKKFLDDEECLAYEEHLKFESWQAQHRVDLSGLGIEPHVSDLYQWLQNHAEDIRGFLPPVAAKPELDIDALKERVGYGLVHIDDVQKWLAGDLK